MMKVLGSTARVIRIIIAILPLYFINVNGCRLKIESEATGALGIRKSQRRMAAITAWYGLVVITPIQFPLRLDVRTIP